MINKFNRYFFPLEEDEKLSLHDAIWFYGTLAFIVLLTVYVVVITW